MDFPFPAPPPPLQTLMALQEQLRPPAAYPSPSGDAISPSLLVIAAIIAFVFVASASIHLLLRYLARQSSSSSSGALSPLVLLRGVSSSSAPATRASPASPPARCQDGEEDLMKSLPLFTLASALAALPKSSLDCAVCLSSFHPHDQLRLLPYCRHAFHSTCIDTWLRSSLSCPLCRSPIVQESPGPPRAPPLPPAAASVTTPPALPASGTDRSGSFRVEMGSVSRRMTQEGDFPELPPHARSYSLGSSFNYVVEEDVEAVVAAIAAHVRRKDEDKGPSDAAPPPPSEDVAEAAGWGGGSRSWLRDYVDRLASSASSSFSSLRFGGCGSRRFDGGVVGGGGTGGGGSWDLEGGGRPRQGEGEQEDEGAGVYYSLYKWLIGA
ncbi:hypothetical protein Taro_010150 [Colocasia esculenta]|uniref:RING-type domain-containing protein n=1 Tax=Colocasia esculenta TaxID=4460 RepID=A0A843U287_COLES|nr:hypothetical protein [Colocasia esculenta]